MVRQSCVDLGRSDLVEFVDSKLLKKDEKEVRILRRNNPNDQNPKDEETKREINKLRIVKKVIRVGNVAMDILVDGYAVSKKSWITLIQSAPQFGPQFGSIVQAKN